jgi:hypothetical protein
MGFRPIRAFRWIDAARAAHSGYSAHHFVQKWIGLRPVVRDRD